MLVNSQRSNGQWSQWSTVKIIQRWKSQRSNEIQSQRKSWFYFHCSSHGVVSTHRAEIMLGLRNSMCGDDPQVFEDRQLSNSFQPIRALGIEYGCLADLVNTKSVWTIDLVYLLGSYFKIPLKFLTTATGKDELQTNKEFTLLILLQVLWKNMQSMIGLCIFTGRISRVIQKEWSIYFTNRNRRRFQSNKSNSDCVWISVKKVCLGLFQLMCWEDMWRMEIGALY